MKNVKWLLIFLLVCTLTSFGSKDGPVEGLRVGDIAPNFMLKCAQTGNSLSSMKKNDDMILLSFWATYDAPSRMLNARVGQIIHKTQNQSNIEKDKTNENKHQVELLSISFDTSKAVYAETLKMDQITSHESVLALRGSSEPLFKRYKLQKGFTNYLINADGVIVAKDLTAKELENYI